VDSVHAMFTRSARMGCTFGAEVAKLHPGTNFQSVQSVASDLTPRLREDRHDP